MTTPDIALHRRQRSHSARQAVNSTQTNPLDRTYTSTISSYDALPTLPPTHVSLPLTASQSISYTFGFASLASGPPPTIYAFPTQSPMTTYYPMPPAGSDTQSSNSSTDNSNPQNSSYGQIGPYSFKILDKPGFLIAIGAAVLGLICTVNTHFAFFGSGKWASWPLVSRSTSAHYLESWLDLCVFLSRVKWRTKKAFTIMIIMRNKRRNRGLKRSLRTVSDMDFGDFRTKASQDHYDAFNLTNEFRKGSTTALEKQLDSPRTQPTTIKFNASGGPCDSIGLDEDEDGSDDSSNYSSSRAPDEPPPSQPSSSRISTKTKSSVSHRALWRDIHPSDRTSVPWNLVVMLCKDQLSLLWIYILNSLRKRWR